MARVQLTDRFCVHVKANPAGRVEYIDTITRGLSLRVTETGVKSWSLIFTSPKDGKRARITLGTYPATSLAQARTAALENKALVGAGRDPRNERSAREAGELTVEALCELYLANWVRHQLRSAYNIEMRLKKNVIPVIGAIRIAELKRLDVSHMTDHIIRRGARVEANRVFETFRAMMRWALQRGYIEQNPIIGMKRPAQESATRERVLSDNEIAHLWHILPTALAGSRISQRILKLCLITGQRVGEVAGMRLSELDSEITLWRLPPSRTKNSDAHTVPLSELARSLIREAMEDSSEDYFFPSPVGGSIDPHAVGTALRRALAPSDTLPQGRLTMASFTPHDLRRTVLTGLAQLGVQPIVIGAIANHRTVTKANVTFARYVQYDYSVEKRDALDRWATALSTIVKNGEATSEAAE